MAKGIRGFYIVTDFIKGSLLEDVNVNTVTYGDISRVDLDKQTIYPLSHINIVSAIPEEQAIVFTVSVISMDIVDVSKEDTEDKFIRNDNEHDVLNTQCAVLTKLLSKIRNFRNINEFEIIGDGSLEPFTDRFENDVAGWVLTFDIAIPNDIYLC